MGMRHNALKVLGLAICMLGLFPGVTGAKQPPNILFILTEDQGAHLSALGTRGLQTPHIDAIAEQGGGALPPSVR